MRLERLARGHVVAAIAALVLLLVMAMDWYGSHEADRAHQVTEGVNVTGPGSGEAGRAVKGDANAIIARDEKNAWQEEGTLDRVLLAFLLLSVFVPLGAAAHRAAGRRSPPPFTPSAAAAVCAAVAALLVAYRIIDRPGNDTQTTLKIGVPLGLIALVVVGLGSASAYQGEANFAQIRRTASQTGIERPPEAEPQDPAA